MNRLTVALCALATGLPLVSACSGGPQYRDVKSTIPGVPPDQSRVFFFRLGSIGASAVPLHISVDGKPIGSLPNGSLLRMEHAPGIVHIVVARGGLPGLLDGGQVVLDMLALAGQEYYLQIAPSSECDISMVGYLGCGIQWTLTKSMDESSAQCDGGFCIARRAKEEAVPKLDPLTVEKPEP